MKLDYPLNSYIQRMAVVGVDRDKFTALYNEYMGEPAGRRSLKIGNLDLSEEHFQSMTVLSGMLIDMTSEIKQALQVKRATGILDRLHGLGMKKSPPEPSVDLSRHVDVYDALERVRFTYEPGPQELKDEGNICHYVGTVSKLAANLHQFFVGEQKKLLKNNLIGISGELTPQQISAEVITLLHNYWFITIGWIYGVSPQALKDMDGVDATLMNAAVVEKAYELGILDSDPFVMNFGHWAMFTPEKKSKTIEKNWYIFSVKEFDSRSTGIWIEEKGVEYNIVTLDIPSFDYWVKS